MIPGSANPLLLASAAAAGGYQVSRSLRFNSSDSGFCSRTFGANPVTRTKLHLHWCVKRGVLGVDQRMISGYNGSSPDSFVLAFTSSDTLRLLVGGGGDLYTTAVFRDPSAWYIIDLAFDSTISSPSADRAKLWVNGTLQTWASGTVTLNALHHFAYGNSYNRIGCGWDNTSFCSLYLAEVFFIDGQALDPSSFTEVSATTGQLIPIEYTGTFGTNGFHLPFSDNSAATAATLGADTSGNGNNWTPNNLSVTAGAGNDSLVDTPTSYGTDTGVGGEVRGNYCTWNPLDTSGGTLTNGNLDLATGTATYGGTRGTVSVSSGKWYWEVTPTAMTTSGELVAIGICASTVALPSQTGSGTLNYTYMNDGQKRVPGSDTNYGATYTVNDVIGVALDLDAGTLVFYKNGASQGTAFSSLSGSFAPYASDDDAAQSCTVVANWGQRAFAYTAPSGFKALCDTNLGAPVVAKPNELMDVVKYDGNGGTQSITGLSFNPDLVWIKGRNATPWHAIFDSVRGTGLRLSSNVINAETGNGSTDLLQSFDSGGFTVNTTLNGTPGDTSVNWDGSGGAASSYVAWAWDAGTSTVSNPDGSITSQVRANVSAGFSVVTWTADAGIYTVGHGLGVKPAMIIHKCRSNAETWLVRHVSIGDSGVLVLNTPAAAGTIAFGGTNTSTVFYNQNAVTTTSGRTMVAYCFAPVVGYSSMGSYVGNASADGPVVYLGFRPRFVIIKCSSTSNLYTNWDINDSARNTYNAADNTLCANLPDQENSVNIGGQPLDFLANGFKIRQATSSSKNLSGQTYIYYAVAENPFQYARAR